MNHKLLFVLGILCIPCFVTACKEQEVIESQLENPPACITANQLTDASETGPLFYRPPLLEFEEESLELSPQLLVPLVLGGNRSLLVSTVQVRKAKQSVNLARSELLPSLNLGALLGSSVSPNFLLSSVEYLLPFLLPSKWADYRQSQDLLKAEKAAFITAQLNQLASAYALFLSIDSGFKIREFLQDEYRDASVVEALTAERVELGELDASSLDLARSEVTTIRGRLWRLQRQINEEIAYMHQALGLCEDVNLAVEDYDVDTSELEVLPYEEAMKKVISASTEISQLRALVRAAKEGRWKQRFSFIGPVSAGESVSGLVPGQDLSFSFSKLVGKASVNFGFAHFARVDLSSTHIDLMEARILEAEMELRKILELNRTAIRSTAKQYDAVDKTVRLLKRVFNADQQRYREQLISLQDMLDSQNRLRQARLERLQVFTDMDLARLALHRLGRTELFSSVRGCAYGIRPETMGEDPLDAACNERFVERKLGMGS